MIDTVIDNITKEETDEVIDNEEEIEKMLGIKKNDDKEDNLPNEII